jgi:tRNA (guanine10-N2)-methyltransferase
MIVRSIGPTYEDVIKFMQSDQISQSLWTPYKENTTFKFTVTAYNHTMKHERQKEILQRFRFVDYKGKASMHNPELEVCVLEDWPDPRCIEGQPYEASSTGIWVGRKVCTTARPKRCNALMVSQICEAQRKLLDTFDLKKRAYIGNTSMEAEMSLIMANQAKAAPGKLLYDPFVGTGSMLYTSAWFGATVMGSDIDGRWVINLRSQARETEKHIRSHIRGRHGKSVYDSAAQYGVKHRILDCTVFDLANNPIRVGGFVDS